jgi:hypothetical protein
MIEKALVQATPDRRSTEDHEYVFEMAFCAW